MLTPETFSQIVERVSPEFGALLFVLIFVAELWRRSKPAAPRPSNSLDGLKKKVDGIEEDIESINVTVTQIARRVEDVYQLLMK